MRTVASCLVSFALLVVLPSFAFAQASISGVVRDTSGAVLPGVTIEAASPVLIEKVRTGTSDGNGRFQMIDLRPGAYTVTFTLAGFNTVKREAVTLSGSQQSIIDAELKVGSLEETITVTGEAPTVDVTTTSRQAVLSADTIDALPSSRNYSTLARMIPAAVFNGTDVGGNALQGTGGSIQIHGSRQQDQRVTLNGVNTMTLQAGGNIGGQIPDVGSAAEVTVDHTAVSAELPTGGVRINFIPKDGGNRFSQSTFFTITDHALVGSNFTDALKTAGLVTPNEVKRNFDLNASTGGPFKRDKVWYWFSARVIRVANYAPVAVNLNAYKPTEFQYAPSTERGLLEGRSLNSSLRTTWQASPRNKFAGTYKQDKWCDCPNGITAVIAPEAARDFRFPLLRQVHGEWTSPLTSKLLAEAVGLHLYERWGFMHLEGQRGSSPEFASVAPQMISVTNQFNGLVYRQTALANNNTKVPNFTYRAALAYVTGSHSFKTGFNRVHGYQQTTNYNSNPLAYTFNQANATSPALPNTITLRANPVTFRNELNNDIGLFAQDKWSRDRTTVNLALRFDHFRASFPEQIVGPAPLAPNRNFVFPAAENLNWNDLTYRTGLVYDIRGNGKTAFKTTFNKYLRGQTLNLLGTDPNPVNTMVTTATRAWTDNGNFIPDCDLLNFAIQDNRASGGDLCGGISNPLFGSATRSATFDDILRRGYGNRETNWEFSAGVQHELLPRVSLDVGYFRRIWKNFRVTDNLSEAASDYQTFSMTVPTDSRLPNGGGYVLDGLVALRPEAFGRPALLNNTLDRTYGSQVEHWNGFDVTVDARLRSGLTLQVGTSTGKTNENDCDIVSKVPEMLNVLGNSFASVIVPAGTPNAWRPASFCQRETPWLTNFKTFGIYTVPKADVQVSGTYRSIPGDPLRAVFNASNAYLAANSSLGRVLAGNAPNIPIDLVAPYSVFLPRRNELDLRFGKVLRAGKTKSVVSLDVFNALNTDVPVNANQNYAVWLRPTLILNARTVKFSVQFDY